MKRYSVEIELSRVESEIVEEEFFVDEGDDLHTQIVDYVASCHPSWPDFEYTINEKEEI